mgnify:FL=1
MAQGPVQQGQANFDHFSTAARRATVRLRDASLNRDDQVTRYAGLGAEPPVAVAGDRCIVCSDREVSSAERQSLSSADREASVVVLRHIPTAKPPSWLPTGNPQPATTPGNISTRAAATTQPPPSTTSATATTQPKWDGGSSRIRGVTLIPLVCIPRLRPDQQLLMIRWVQS